MVSAPQVLSSALSLVQIIRRTIGIVATIVVVLRASQWQKKSGQQRGNECFFHTEVFDTILLSGGGAAFSSFHEKKRGFSRGRVRKKDRVTIG